MTIGNDHRKNHRKKESMTIGIKHKELNVKFRWKFERVAEFAFPRINNGRRTKNIKRRIGRPGFMQEGQIIFSFNVQSDIPQNVYKQSMSG